MRENHRHCGLGVSPRPQWLTNQATPNMSSNANSFIQQAGFPVNFTEETLQDYLIEYYRYIGYFVAKEVVLPIGRADIVIGHLDEHGSCLDAMTGLTYNAVAVIEVKKWLDRSEALQAFGQATGYASCLGNIPIIIAGLLSPRDSEAAQSVARRFSATGAKFFFVDQTPEFYNSNWGRDPLSVLPTGFITADLPTPKQTYSPKIFTPNRNYSQPLPNEDSPYKQTSILDSLTPSFRVLGSATKAACNGLTVASSFVLKTAWKARPRGRKSYYTHHSRSQAWYMPNNFLKFALMGYFAFAVWCVVTQPQENKNNTPTQQSMELIK